MLIAIVLDRPLAETKALLEASNAFIQAITRIMQDKHNHPVIAQMINPFLINSFVSSKDRALERDRPNQRKNCANDQVRGKRWPSTPERAASSSGGHSRRGAVTRLLDKYTIPTNASGQRKVLTVVAHQTPVTESQCPTIGVTGQHEVLMVGYYT